MSTCHAVVVEDTFELDCAEGIVLVALAGQPNVGKSTVFNVLTGLNQHVGNWPGKTVEQKTGFHHLDGTTIHLVDLPGTYSLTANSLEEVIARDYIIRERPEVVVVVINAATMERNLYLVAELLPFPSKVIVGLNMVDVAADEGLEVEPQVFGIRAAGHEGHHLRRPPHLRHRSPGFIAVLACEDDSGADLVRHPREQGVRPGGIGVQQFHDVSRPEKERTRGLREPGEGVDEPGPRRLEKGVGDQPGDPGFCCGRQVL